MIYEPNSYVILLFKVFYINLSKLYLKRIYLKKDIKENVLHVKMKQNGRSYFKMEPVICEKS